MLRKMAAPAMLHSRQQVQMKFYSDLLSNKETKMFQQTRRILTIIVTFSVLLHSGLLGAVKRAQAGSPDLWAHWTLQVDFDNQQINARWTVAIGEFVAGASPAMQTLVRKTQPIDCLPQGSFQIINNEAIFDGSGHLKCHIPSFYHEAMALAAGAGLTLGEKFMERCECVNPVPWLTSDLTVATARSANPIVHEVNGAFSFYTPATLGHDGSLQATSNMLINGQPFDPSFAWTVRPNGNQIWSGTGTESYIVLGDHSWGDFLGPSFYVAARSTPADDFLHWENANGAQTFPTSSKMSITNQPTTFLVGYDGKEHFVGKIKKLAWDPGCTAH
jgi:hypothetical protein